MIKYSHKAAPALAFLKKNYNDIDIFVEDTGNPSMWVSFLRGLLPSSVRLESVNMLGGRTAVVSACKTNTAPTNRPTIYIIDSDMDVLLGLKKPRSSNLYRLPAYCIENFLINKDSIEKISITCRPDLPPNSIKSIFEFQSWIDKNIRPLFSLFVIYAVVKALIPSQATISLGCSDLYLSNHMGVSICPHKTLRRVRMLARQIIKEHGYKIFRNELAKIKERARRTNMINLISAKDYIIPPLYITLRQSVGYKGTIDQMKAHLAQYSTPKIEPKLSKKLRSIISIS